MKFIWEESDIKTGRMYSRVDINENWMIGYRSYAVEEARFVSISMVDGMVTAPLNKNEMADMLTRGGYVPIEFLKVMATQ